LGITADITKSTLHNITFVSSFQSVKNFASSDKYRRETILVNVRHPDCRALTSSCRLRRSRLQPTQSQQRTATCGHVVAADPEQHQRGSCFRCTRDEATRCQSRCHQTRGTNSTAKHDRITVSISNITTNWQQF